MIPSMHDLAAQADQIGGFAASMVGGLSFTCPGSASRHATKGNIRCHPDSSSFVDSCGRLSRRRSAEEAE
jgi:hypothetical protein